jgi:3-phenylpropionate/cinnamic acid dioxygenase small subunit
MSVQTTRQAEIEQFLFAEADLLDERRFEEWVELFADDVHYWMPTRSNLGRRQRSDVSGPEDVAHFDDTKQTLRLRVARIDTGFAWAEQPPTRTRRLIANVQVAPAEADGELDVRSNYLVYCNSGSTLVNIFAGQRRDVLRPTAAGSWSIARRTILLDQTVVLANSISIFF